MTAFDNVLDQCLAVGAGEEIVLLADEGTDPDVVSGLSNGITERDAIPLVARMPNPRLPGAEPPGAVAAMMRHAAATIELTSLFIGSSAARRAATDRGARYLAMPGVRLDTFRPGGPLTVDFEQLRIDAENVGAAWDRASEFRLTSRAGTDLRGSVENRPGRVLHGMARAPGAYMAPPDVEAGTAPVEGTATGVVVIDADLLFMGQGPLDEPVVLHVADGMLTGIEGAARGRLESMLERCADDRMANIAEVSMGFNPNGTVCSVPMETESSRGSAHIALGNSIAYGGRVNANPANVMEQSEELSPIYGSRQWEVLSQKERDELGHHLSAWLFSQFLHGEQGALTVAARIVESVPDMDSKFYAATQAMDEARHVELYSRFMREKIGLYYPVNPDLAKLLADALSDSRWDMPYLGMQVLIEGLALAAFGVHRDMSNNALVTQLLAYVMQDEARHVAFGRLALRDYYRGLTDAERADREEFVVEGCYLMRNRFQAQEVWERMGFDVQECLDFTEQSPVQQAFRTLLFSRIVPCVKDIGLWGPKVQRAFADLGVIDAAKSDLDALMRADEEIAERVDEQKYAAELAARQAEVDAAVTEGAGAS